MTCQSTHALCCRPCPRRGLALIAVLVTLVVIAMLMSAVAWQILAGRRMLRHREHEVQAEWLARAGAEYAAVALATHPEQYRGETLQLLERSSVAIHIEGLPDSPNVYRITSQARYPLDVTDVVTRSIVRTLRLEEDAD